MRSMLVFILVLVQCITASAQTPIELEVIRSQHTLLVKRGDTVLRSFKVALGSGGRKAKTREGDHATPTGTYHIRAIRESDRFHLFLQLDYPNVSDARRALKNHSITRQQYRDILEAHVWGLLPPQDTFLGGQIGIHGIGHETPEKLKIHQVADWTQGCIALRNGEVDELVRYIQIGTRVHIVDHPEPHKQTITAR